MSLWSGYRAVVEVSPPPPVCERATGSWLGSGCAEHERGMSLSRLREGDVVTLRGGSALDPGAAGMEYRVAAVGDEVVLERPGRHGSRTARAG
jgi:hypothetical protein